jgi:hypothetical protein
MSLQLKLLTGVLALLASLSADSATYYVDQSAGSDSNTGTSPSAPWKNAPGMSSFGGSGRLSPGDTVYFDRADTWLVTGTQGIWLVGGVTYIGNGWGAGTRATLRANADIASSIVRFRDHATTPTVFRGFDVDGNNRVTTGIEMNGHFYAGPLTGAMKTIDNVVVHNTNSTASLGQYKYGILISNHSTNGTDGLVSNVEILNSVVHDTSRDGINLYPGDENAGCIISNITVRGNEVYNTGTDTTYGAGSGIIVKGRVQNAVIEKNYVHNTGVAGAAGAYFFNGNETKHYGFGMTGITVRYNIANVNNVAQGGFLFYDGAGTGDPKQVDIYGNIVYGNGTNQCLLVSSGLKNANTLRFYNNTCYNAPILIQNSTATFPTFALSNNIAVCPSCQPMNDQDSASITSHTNNVFRRTSGTTLVTKNGTNYTAGTLTTYEATALSSDPLFSNTSSLPTGFLSGVPSTTGLSLQAGSPSIDSGADLGSSYQPGINGVTRSGSWDRGAYETASNRLPPPTNLRVLQ